MAVNQVLAPGVAVGDVVLLKKIPNWLVSDSSLEEFFRFMRYIGRKSLVTDIDPYGYYWLGFGSTQQGPDGAIYSGDSFCVTGDCIQKCADREANLAWLFLGPGFS
ncbi:hypothetical protein [Vandammella animalimorsus]|uniref:Uncharacterized protein n=1 Tax=Vandammella animalimorsus TaxID=2029117 RepID=A0A2A2AWJ0_9BURK|nr:hypothetical protein [Vandammella animalimorsus]PAT42955.1 hypothetical protein CK621_06790 [Vandammella animalimorsus]